MEPSMTEVVELLHELLASSLSLETHLHDFFKACVTQGRDGRGEEAQEFADELDEVCHTERHTSVDPSNHRSRHLTTWVFPRKNGSNI